MGLEDMFRKKCQKGDFANKTEAQNALDLTRQYAQDLNDEIFTNIQNFIDTYDFGA